MLNTYNNYYKIYLYIYYVGICYNFVRVIGEILYIFGYYNKYLESVKFLGDVLRNRKMIIGGFIF